MKKGFTLLEITVVIAIIILLSSIIMANYREGERQFALKRSVHKLAQDLRGVEEMVLSSQKTPPGFEKPGEEETFPKGGYGIYFQKGFNTYILFADCDGDHRYDENGAAQSCKDATSDFPYGSYPEKIKILSLEEGITISGLLPSSIDNSLSVTLFPPDPAVFVYSSVGVADSAIITLTFGNQSKKTVSINKVGLIDIE